MYMLSTIEVYDNAIYTIKDSGTDYEKYMPTYMTILGTF